MKQISQGAEARIYSDGKTVVKHRFEKKYRHPELDKALRKYRTRREAKILEKLRQMNFPGPVLADADDNEMKIIMNHVHGELLKDVLHENPAKLSREIGKKLALLHKNNIIHDDLTTSNMILSSEIHFIDFGLSFFSERDEDKAVDLHLLKRALESKHHTICEECFSEVVKGYKESYENAARVLSRFEVVERRGRNKEKGS